jgi:glycosyltransferase involved in cell wall biosynthesis
LTELVTPLKPLEAMAMRKALVASDIGGHRELVQHDVTGLLFPAADLAALVRTLCSLVCNPEAREKLSETAFRWVRSNHTWFNTTAPYRTIYQRALAK